MVSSVHSWLPMASALPDQGLVSRVQSWVVRHRSQAPVVTVGGARRAVSFPDAMAGPELGAVSVMAVAVGAVS